MKKTSLLQLAVIATFAAALSATAVAADIDEMLTSAIGKLKSDIRTAKMDIQKVAVYAIEPDREGKVNVNMVQDQVEIALMDSGRFKVINRKALKALLEEQALSLTGVVDEAQMVKAGKLIGAQGFFYGSVELQKDKLILTMKLIEVESSAVAYSKKFVGESRAFARLGIGYMYSMAPGMGLKYRVASPAPDNNNSLNPQPGGLDNVGASAVVGAALSYRQGFQSISFAQLGLDIAFASYRPATETVKSQMDELATTASGSFVYTANVMIREATMIAITPKLYFTTRDLFGFERDILNPYIGATIASFSISYRFTGSGMYTSGAYAGSYSGQYSELKRSADVIAIMPVIGLEANATKSLSAFVEGGFLAGNAEPSEGKLSVGLPDNSLSLEESMPYISKGLFLNLGLKYYFNLF